MISISKEKYHVLHFILYGSVLGFLHWLVIDLFNVDFSHLKIIVIYGALSFIHLGAYLGGKFLQMLFPEFSAQLLLVSITVKMLVSLILLLVVIYPLGPHSNPFAIHFMIAYMFMLGMITYKYVKIFMKIDK